MNVWVWLVVVFESRSVKTFPLKFQIDSQIKKTSETVKSKFHEERVKGRQRLGQSRVRY